MAAGKVAVISHAWDLREEEPTGAYREPTVRTRRLNMAEAEEYGTKI